MENMNKQKFNENKKREINDGNIYDTFGKLKRKVSGQKFKDRARKGW